MNHTPFAHHLEKQCTERCSDSAKIKKHFNICELFQWGSASFLMNKCMSTQDEVGYE